MSPSAETLDALRLPPVLDMQAAASLAEALVVRQGADLRLDGADVQRLGAQCVQVLLCAHATWHADGHALSLVDASAELLSGLALLGVDPESPLLKKGLLP